MILTSCFRINIPRIRFILILLIIHFEHYGQNLDIKDIISQVNLDSLVLTVETLSGERSAIIDGQSQMITNRSSSFDNNLAAQFIKESLLSHGVNTFEQNYRPGGRNIIAVQPGTKFRNEFYLICAHYDAVPNSLGADDNASGVAAVLEAARILSKKEFEYSIVYALWDEEEQGVHGSRYYADLVASTGTKILGVLNLEMLGYDGIKDQKFDIHINADPASIALKTKLISVLDQEQMNLKPIIIDPGSDASDHGPFWHQGYPAIVFGESFFGGDANPAYHTPDDRIDLFDKAYFLELSRLAIATLATLAFEPQVVTSILDLNSENKVSVYPNPVDQSLNIKFSRLTKAPTIKIIDLQGQVFLQIEMENQLIQKLDLVHLSSGLYLLKIFIDDKPKVIKLLKN